MVFGTQTRDMNKVLLLKNLYISFYLFNVMKMPKREKKRFTIVSGKFVTMVIKK